MAECSSLEWAFSCYDETKLVQSGKRLFNRFQTEYVRGYVTASLIMTIKTICQLGNHSVYLAEDKKKKVFIIEEWEKGKRTHLRSVEVKDTLGSDLEDGALLAFAKEALFYDQPIVRKM